MARDTPRSIVLRQQARDVEVTWVDGTVSRYPFAWLRCHCRCADCTAARRASGHGPPSTSEVIVTGCATQGHYAIQFTFDDGHFRGIYPWAYLREIDPAGAGGTPSTAPGHP
jgi:DUF971 family protein